MIKVFWDHDGGWLAFDECRHWHDDWDKEIPEELFLEYRNARALLEKAKKEIAAY